MKKPKNTICLWFNKDAHDAARFYAATFPDSKVTAVHLAPSDYPSGKKGDELTVEFTVLGIPCLGLNGGPEFKHSEAFSFQIATDNQEETDRYWNAIVGNGGKESQCGWCKDRWGLNWQITPRVLTDALAAGGDRGQACLRGDDADEEDRHRHHRGGAVRGTRLVRSGLGRQIGFLNQESAVWIHWGNRVLVCTAENSTEFRPFSYNGRFRPLLGGRSTVGQQTLTLLIGVRIPASQPNSSRRTTYV